MPLSTRQPPALHFKHSSLFQPPALRSLFPHAQVSAVNKDTEEVFDQFDEHFEDILGPETLRNVSLDQPVHSFEDANSPETVAIASHSADVLLHKLLPVVLAWCRSRCLKGTAKLSL